MYSIHFLTRLKNSFVIQRGSVPILKNEIRTTSKNRLHTNCEIPLWRLDLTAKSVTCLHVWCSVFLVFVGLCWVSPSHKHALDTDTHHDPTQTEGSGKTSEAVQNILNVCDHQVNKDKDTFVTTKFHWSLTFLCLRLVSLMLRTSVSIQIKALIQTTVL